VKAFLSGSQVYGEPTEESDIDLIIRMAKKEMDKLIKILSSKGQIQHIDPNYDNGQVSIKIGTLNLLICYTDKRYLSWATGTKALRLERRKKGKPLSRERAVEVFSGLRDMLEL